MHVRAAGTRSLFCCGARGTQQSLARTHSRTDAVRESDAHSSSAVISNENRAVRLLFLLLVLLLFTHNSERNATEKSMCQCGYLKNHSFLLCPRNGPFGE